MPPCTLDLTTSKTLRRSIKTLSKKFPNAQKDLEEIGKLISADHTCRQLLATPLRAPGKPDLAQKVWKYDCPSSDLKKHGRECFRFLAIFVDGTLYGVHLCQREGNDYWSAKDLEDMMKKLRASIASLDDAEEDGQQEGDDELQEPMRDEIAEA